VTGSRRRERLIVCAASAATLCAFYSLMKILLVRMTGVDIGLFDVLPFALGGFFLLGIFVGFRITEPAELGFRFLAAYAGIAAGVLLWVGAEEFIFRRFGTHPIYQSHDLWPIEIVLWWLVAVVPIAVGTFLTRLVPGLRRRKGTA
jgi:hypothetical protein